VLLRIVGFLVVQAIASLAAKTIENSPISPVKEAKYQIRCANCHANLLTEDLLKSRLVRSSHSSVES
jgi:hypothetical protein